MSAKTPQGTETFQEATTALPADCHENWGQNHHDCLG